MPNSTVKPLELYTLDEKKTFVKTWGQVFKSMKEKMYNEAYYHACIDAYFCLEQKPIKFYTYAGLRRTLLDIASEFESLVKQKKGTENDANRAAMFRYIANTDIKAPSTEGVQSELFK